MAQSNASGAFVCALTGQSPLEDPVVTPSGYVCSRRLLLAKLAENGGVDPFHNDETGKRNGSSSAQPRTLDESQLVDLRRRGVGGSDDGMAPPAPPRPPSATSLPSLLTLIRDEHDAVLLELYDSRKALEETRRELSAALYQNDAAVRVVARMAGERDEARRMAEESASRAAAAAAAGAEAKAEADAKAANGANGGAAAAAAVALPAQNKRGRDDGGDASPSKRGKVSSGGDAAAADAAAPSEGIPPSELDAMVSAWKALSKSRRAKSKAGKKKGGGGEADAASAAYEDRLAGFGELRKVNLHRSSAPAGALCLSSFQRPGAAVGGGAGCVVAGGRDKRAVVYDVDSGRTVAALVGHSAEVSTVHAYVTMVPEEGEGKDAAPTVWLVTGGADGTVRLYSSTDGKENAGGEGEDDDEAFVFRGEATFDTVDPIVFVAVHPSSTVGEARIMASTRGGKVALLKGTKEAPSSDSSSSSLEVLAVLMEKEGEESSSAKYASGALHPDGLIFAAGTTDGRLMVWDLKTQKIVSGLKCHDGSSVDCVAFSENGYHLSTSSSSSPTVLIWDLRKLKTVATINNSDGDEGVGNVRSVAFDPDGTHLAYSGERGTRVCVAKDWNRVVCTLEALSSSSSSDGGVRGATAWGPGGAWLATCCDGERPTRFWGAKGDVGGGDEDKPEEVDGDLAKGDVGDKKADGGES